MKNSLIFRWSAWATALILFGLIPLVLIGADGLAEWKILTITPDQLPEILRTHGPLEKLSAKEFADLQTMVQPPKANDLPRLVRAKYRARLQTLTIETKGQAATTLIGSAEWTIAQKSNTLQRLPLGEISVGLGLPRWQDGTVAWLTGGENSALLSQTQGERTLNVDWSARGGIEAGELRWELRLPKSPMAELELELPNGWTPYTSQNDLVFTGPFGANENLKTWRIHFGGEARLELVIRPPNQQKANRFHTVQLAHEIFPDKIISNGIFRIESQPSPVDEFTLSLDRSIEVVLVRTNNLLQWNLTQAEGNKNLVKVNLTEPTRSLTLTLVLIQRGYLGEQWKLPFPSLLQSTLTGLEVRTIFPEEVTAQDWKFGSYRLVQSTVNGSNQWIADFQPISTQPDGQLIPISFRPKIVGCVWNCKQETQWFPWDADRLETAIYLDIQRGSLNKLTLRVPAGTEVEQVEMNLVGLNISQGESPTRLEIAFSRPLNKADREPLRLRCRLPGSQLVEARPFPDLEPLGWRERSGSYRIQPPVGMILETRTALLELPDPQTKSYSFGLAGVSGLLDLRPSIGNLRTQSITTMTPERISTRLTITPQNGKLSDVVIVAPSELESWSQVGERTTISGEMFDLVRLLSPKMELLCWGLPSRSVHRYHLNNPTEEPLTLVAEGKGTQSRYTTLPLVLGSQMESEVTCPARYQLERVDAQNSSDSSSRLQRFVGASGLIRVRPTERLQPIHVSPVQVQTNWTNTERLKSLLRFRVLADEGGILPITWPEQARVLSIKINDKSHPVSPDPLSIPVALEPVNIEIEYDQPVTQGGIIRCLDLDLPSIDHNTTGIERTWVLSSGWLLLNPRYWYRPSRTTQNPRLADWIEPLLGLDSSETWRSFPEAHSRLWIANRSHLFVVAVSGSILLGLAILLVRRGKRLLLALGMVLLLLCYWLPDGLRPILLLSAGILWVMYWRFPSRLARPEPAAALSKPFGMLIFITGTIFYSWISPVFAQTITIIELTDPSGRGDSTWYLPVGFAEKIRQTRYPAQILSANYTTKLEANLFKAEARYLIWVFEKGSRRLKIPLTGVRLRSAILNGSEVFPISSGDDGFEFECKGVGEQNLVLNFEVSSKIVGPEREIRFGVPEHPVSQLTIESDLSLRDLRLVAWRGAIRINKSEESEKIVADLGRVKSITLRGRIPTKGVDLPLRSRACHIWTIDGAFAKLDSTFDYDRIPSGGISQIRLAIPDKMGIQDVAVRLVDASALPVGVKSWRISSERTNDDWPIVVIDFSETISSRFRLQVKLVPANLLPTQTKVRMIRSLGSFDSEAYLALRFLNNSEKIELESTNASEISAEVFQKKIAPLIVGEPNILPVRSAYRRGLTGEPTVTFKTWPDKSPLLVEGAITAKHSPLGVTLQGTLNLNGLAGESYLELEGLGGIPTFALLNDEILSWSRLGTKAEVFFKKGLNQVTINLVGSIPLEPKTEWIEFPNLRIKGSKALSIKWKLTPAEGAILVPVKSEGLTRSEENRDWHWVQNFGETSGPRFRWFQPIPPPPLNLFLTEQAGEIQTTVNISTADLDPTRPHVFSIWWPDLTQVRIRENWPKSVPVKESIEKNSRLWTFELPVGNKPVSLAMTLTRPFTESLSIPRIYSSPGIDNETIIQLDPSLRLNGVEREIRWRYGDSQTLSLSKQRVSQTRIADFELVSVPVQKGWVHQAKIKGTSLNELRVSWEGKYLVQQIQQPNHCLWSWRTDTISDVLPKIVLPNGEPFVPTGNWLVQVPMGLSVDRFLPESKENTTQWEWFDTIHVREGETYRIPWSELPKLTPLFQPNTSHKGIFWAVLIGLMGGLLLGSRTPRRQKFQHILLGMALLLTLGS